MSAIMSRWYWVHDGRQGGPITWDELQALARRGRLRADDPVLREGTKLWKPAASARADEPAPTDLNSTNAPPPSPPLPAGALAAPAAAATIVEDLVDGDPPRQPSSNRGMQRMMIGTAFFLGGIFLTYLSYEASQAFFGGKFIVFRGMIIFGIIQFIRGIADAGSD
jgi:hypothetical protein